MEGWTDPRLNLVEVTKHHVQSSKGGNRGRERRRATVYGISDTMLGTPLNHLLIVTQSYEVAAVTICILEVMKQKPREEK